MDIQILSVIIVCLVFFNAFEQIKTDSEIRLYSTATIDIPKKITEQKTAKGNSADLTDILFRKPVPVLYFSYPRFKRNVMDENNNANTHLTIIPTATTTIRTNQEQLLKFKPDWYYNFQLAMYVPFIPMANYHMPQPPREDKKPFII